MEIKTTEFEWSHGKKPRGEGCWAFAFGKNKTPVFVSMMKWSEAKKWATAKARELGVSEVTVLP